MRQAIREFDELMDDVRSTLRRGNGRKLTATIAWHWEEWSALIGRGRPFGARDAADALGVPTRSIHTAMSRIARRPEREREREETIGKDVSTERSGDKGWIEESPHYREGDRADYAQGKIVRSDREFGKVRIDPETGNADYSIR